jgi:hypothetical protein
MDMWINLRCWGFVLLVVLNREKKKKLTEPKQATSHQQIQAAQERTCYKWPGHLWAHPEGKVSILMSAMWVRDGGLTYCKARLTIRHHAN